ncbi:alpha/beta hydrolase family protein [Acidicapsa acidisoli]|uniref:alpha/beta hydrolase family protein n=1 Tax=Acidicapsa acidisoli TaxID=1615681 RepID=UPI0021E0C022|nr:acetylxylan esterase [Acidicapsa acidisoli]
MRLVGKNLLIAIAAAIPMTAVTMYGQATSDTLKSLLEQPVQTTDVTAFQLQKYLSRRITALPSPQSASDWTDKSQSLRKHILDDIAFHGWPSEWIQSAPKFSQVGAAESRNGYRVTKFRYEIVPGFEATALLYEPEKLNGRAPAILNVIGHEPMGEAAEYEQKRCINFAKRGIIALSIGWVGFGELALKGNDHDDAAALDLVGSNALGFFYLGMRHGLDYLAALPQVDTTRLGVTGLSGGGWQTILLSALDSRVAVSVEVAGFGSLQSNLTHPIDTDEIEEDATDLNQGEDYPFLVAMRAPRPTLLIHNAEDNCCFRASIVKPYIYDQVRPFFNLSGKPDALGWYESTDPGTHNYQLVNRLHSYSFFAEHFNMPAVTDEIPSSTEVKTREELAVGIPADNLTITGLARKIAGGITRQAVPHDGDARKSWAVEQRKKLKEIIRYTPVSVENAWRVSNTRRLAMQTVSYRFDLTNELSATGIWLKANDAGEGAPATIVLNDKGYEASSEAVSTHVNHGEQVLALDLLFNGFTRPQTPDPTDWELLTASVGDRPLGLEVAQLLGIAHWMRANSSQKKVEIETDGIRSAVIASVAAAIDPDSFSVITSRHAMKSFGYLLDTPVAFRSAPDLFCLDLYKYFDIDSIAAIADSTIIKNVASVQ